MLQHVVVLSFINKHTNRETNASNARHCDEISLDTNMLLVAADGEIMEESHSGVCSTPRDFHKSGMTIITNSDEN